MSSGAINSTLLLRKVDAEIPSSARKRRSLDSTMCSKYLESRRCSAAGRLNILNRSKNEDEINKKEDKVLGIKNDYDVGDSITNKKSSILINENNAFVDENRACPIIVPRHSVSHIRPKTSPNNSRRYSLDNKNDINKRVIRQKSLESSTDQRRETLVPMITSSFDKDERPNSERVTLDDNIESNKDGSHQSQNSYGHVKDDIKDCQNQICSNRIQNNALINKDYKHDKRRNSDEVRQCDRNLDGIVRSTPLVRPKTSLQKMSDYLKNNKDDQNNYDKIKIMYDNNVNDIVIQQQKNNTNCGRKSDNLDDMIHSERDSSRPSTATYIAKYPKISDNGFPRPIIISSDEPVLTPKQFFSSLLVLSQAFVSSFTYSPNFKSATSEEEIYKIHNTNIKNINDNLQKVPYFILKKKDENEITPRIRKYSLPSIPKQKLIKNDYLEYRYNYFIFNDNNRDLIDDINNEQIKKIWKISIFLLLFKNLFQSKIGNHRKDSYETKTCLDRQTTAVGHIERAYYRYVYVHVNVYHI